MKSIIVINFKTYKQGKNAVKLAEAAEKIDKKIIVGVQASDVYEIAKKTKLKVYVQHVDYFKSGRHTGYILPDAVQKQGAKGSLLNHSEHRLKFDILKKTIKRCREIGLKTIVCVASLKEARNVLKLNAEIIAFEVPELIASGKSISKLKPDSVKKFSKAVREYNQKNNKKIEALCGAGISSKDDVEKALELGCDGVLLASAITKARNSEKKLKELFC